MGQTPAGQRDRLVAFERPTVTKSALGPQKAVGWQQIERAWAAVRFGRSQERRDAAAEGASQVATFRVLSTTALRTADPQCRIVLDGAAWNIIGSAAIGGQANEIEFTAMLAKG